jgi:hypothetical protein
MNLLQILKMSYPQFDDSDCKVHLAVKNTVGEDPLNEFLSGRFKEWQEIQTKKNFSNKYILSLIQIPDKKNMWLFAGLYISYGSKVFYEKNARRYKYSTQQLADDNLLAGRAIISFERSSRQSYPYFNKLKDKFKINEIKANPIAVQDFPGHENVRIKKEILDLIVSQGVDSWRGGLRIPGIYLITDLATGRFYVGKADGRKGIWQRWSEYSKSGHGGDVDLRKLLSEKGSDYAKNFQFSVLEITDAQSLSEIDVRESHWKEVLASRTHGYNKN